ncbi:hypothetical protein ORG37_18745 [Rahnella perminowiae]|uniref:hypothetical protein n=1 Tax=Rahnella perminowiae TaxID=2816244 RepID=UPI00224AA2E0|nr:hypothetical protein [Rahnella perminowiae]MCX2945123.1 hypothetical protein [Rahnella perminowiae]
MRRVKIGALFVFLDPGEAIPRFDDQEFFSDYTNLIRPCSDGFEILRYQHGAGWQRKPEQIFESANAALSYGYEEYCIEWERVAARFEPPKYRPDWRGFKNYFEI